MPRTSCQLPQLLVDWLLLADDLTGALDSGVHFARAGLKTIVPLQKALGLSGAQALVINTESRRMTPKGAASACREAARNHPAAAVFKKIDSILRGYPAIELGAVMTALGIDRALVAPAFPAQGRVTRGGRVWVGGRPLEGEAASQSRQGDLTWLFRACAPLTLLSLEQVRGALTDLTVAMQGAGVFIGDAETDGDLERLALAARLSDIHLLCGSSGLAKACAGPPRSVQGLRWPRPRLAVVGSRHPVSQAQVEFARRRGVRVLEAAGLASAADPGEALEQLAAGSADDLRRHQPVVIYPGRADQPAIGEAIMAERLGRLATEVLQRTPVGGLYLSGGDTAMAVCRSLRVAELELVDEVLPGLPLCRFTGGLFPGLTAITKAGAFGDESTLTDLLDLP